MVAGMGGRRSEGRGQRSDSGAFESVSTAGTLRVPGRAPAVETDDFRHRGTRGDAHPGVMGGADIVAAGRERARTGEGTQSPPRALTIQCTNVAPAHRPGHVDYAAA